MKGLTLHVFTDASYGPIRLNPDVFHAAGGKRTVTLVEVCGEPLPKGSQVFTATPESPAVRLVRRLIGGEKVLHVEPVEKPSGMKGGPMFGGAYVASSDGRVSELFGFYGAVALHDRFEG